MQINKLIKDIEKKLSELRTKISTADELIVENKLRTLISGSRIGWFMDIIHTPDTYIAGGLILQIVTGDTWQTDIDIFTSNSAVCQKISHFGRIIENSVGKHYPDSVQSYYLDGCKIDVIQCDPIKRISEFDLDICKCYFDGSRISIINPDSVRHSRLS